MFNNKMLVLATLVLTMLVIFVLPQAQAAPVPYTISTSATPKGNYQGSLPLGPQVSDMITINGVQGTSGTFHLVSARLNGPNGFSAQGTAADLTTSSFPATMNVASSNVKIFKPGLYCWDVTIQASGGYDRHPKSESGILNQQTECFTMPPLQYTISTLATPRGPYTGSYPLQSPTDNVIINGVNGVTGTFHVSGILHGPNTFGIRAVEYDLTTSSFPATMPIGPRALPWISDPGQYCWDVTIQASGGYVTKPVNEIGSLNHQTECFTIPNHQYTISTLATPRGPYSGTLPLVNPSDTIIINGIQGVRGTFHLVSATLRGPPGFAPNGMAADVTTISYPATMQIGFRGLPRVTTPGQYCWDVAIQSTLGYVTDLKSETGSLNQETECFTIPNLVISTSIKAGVQNNDVTGGTVSPGTLIHDTATITGLSGTSTGSTTGSNFLGTVDYVRYPNINCFVDPNNLFPNIVRQTVTLLGDGTVPDSSIFTLAGAGDSSYKAFYSGSTNPFNPATTGQCEPIKFRYTPTITTQADPAGQVDLPLDSVTDSVTITGSGGIPAGIVNLTLEDTTNSNTVIISVQAPLDIAGQAFSGLLPANLVSGHLFCWNVDYVPDAGSPYAPASFSGLSDQQHECFTPINPNS